MALHLTQVLEKPLSSEKNTIVASTENVYAFQVHRAANKQMIKQAVEQLLVVKVEEVRTMQLLGKARRVGKHSGTRAQTKKAFVKVAAGQTIDYFVA